MTLGSARIPMWIDIGFGNAIEPGATDEDYPTLLDMPAPRIRAYPREAIVAEKLHAMVVLGERNSRFKDFRDLYVQARQFAFEGERLTGAIAATFARRKTAIEAVLPAALTTRFYADGTRAGAWRAYLGGHPSPDGPADWTEVGEVLRGFLEPPWRAIADSNKFSQSWSPAARVGELERRAHPRRAVSAGSRPIHPTRTRASNGSERYRPSGAR